MKEEGAKRLLPSSFEIYSQPLHNERRLPSEQSLLATLKVTFNNIESAPNQTQTQPETPYKNKNNSQNTNRTN